MSFKQDLAPIHFTIEPFRLGVALKNLGIAIDSECGEQLIHTK